MNILSVIGTLMSLVALALAIAQGTLHKFVEVFIPTDVSNPDDPELSCSIAGLGIFTTVYDSSCLDPAVLASSRVPSEKFTSPTTEFKLLFPAQENFVAEVLPINTELLGTFDALFGAAPGQGFATAALGEEVAAISNTEFEDCTQYMTDINANMLALFAPLNTALLPLIVPLIINDTVTSLKTAVGSIDGSLGAPALSGLNVLQALDVATWVGLSLGLNAFCGLSSNLSATFDATDAACIRTVYNNTGASFLETNEKTFSVLSGLGALFPLCATIPGLNTPSACLGGSFSTQITTVELFVPATFASGPPFGTFCDVTNICGDGSGSKAEIAAAAAEAAVPLLSAVDPATLSLADQLLFAQVATAVEGLGAYALVMGFLAGPVFTATATITTATAADAITLLESTLVLTTFPATQTGFYTPCAILQIGAQALASQGFTSNFLGDTPGTCGFNVFFAGAAEVAAFTANPLAELIGALGELYSQCAVPLFALAPTECHLLFPSIFISGAYSFDLNVTAFSKTTPDAVFLEGIAACEDDATDLEKIKLAQILFIICLATFSLSVFAGIASLALPKLQALISVLAGLLVVLALSTNLGALLAVRSAPVYDAVSEEPEVDKPYYAEGIVVLLALVTVIVSALTAALYFGAAFAAVKGKCGAGKSEGEEEIKASLATTMAKEDPEAKPSI